MCTDLREKTPKYHRNDDFFAVYDIFMTAVAMTNTENSQNTQE